MRQMFIQWQTTICKCTEGFRYLWAAARCISLLLGLLLQTLSLFQATAGGTCRSRSFLGHPLTGTMMGKMAPFVSRMSCNTGVLNAMGCC